MVLMLTMGSCNSRQMGQINNLINSIDVKDQQGRQDLGNGIYLINGHRFVDLGLPSGMLWAENNIGANKPADTGYFFAWGETAPKQEYSPETYKYCNVALKKMTKYNDQENHHQKLQKEDDAASVNWGDECRMPTMLDFGEMKESCTFTAVDRTNSNGQLVYGFLVTSNVNGNKIFLPAAGTRYENIHEGFNECGTYWLKGQRTVPCGNFMVFDFRKRDFNFSTSSLERYYGMTIRPVAEPI